MKLERNSSTFEPIIITLESEVEARALRTVLGFVTGSGTIRDLTSKIFWYLDKEGINKFPEINGNRGRVHSVDSDLFDTDI